MSSVTSPSMPGDQELDKPHISVNTNNNKLIVESNSDDLTISQHFESTTNASANAIKSLPLVYIQNRSKMPFATITKTPNSNNVVVNTIPQFKLTTINPNKTLPPTTVSIQNNANIIFASKKPNQPVVIQKQINNLGVGPPGAKIAPGTYVTMLKPIPKPSETILSKIQLPNAKIPENLIVDNNGFLKTSNQSQKIVFAPVPKSTSNRPPATITTNSVQPKITVLPMPVPSSELASTKKIYNIKISDGQIQAENTSSAITIMKESAWNANDINHIVNAGVNVSEKSLSLEECDNRKLGEKNDILNTTYELSIAEDSLSDQSDVKLVVSSMDSNSSNGDYKSPLKLENKPKEASKFTHGISILKKNFYSNDRKPETQNNILQTSNPVAPISDNCSGEVEGQSEVKEEEKVPQPPPQPQIPKERRRKSNFTCRKDFDNMDVAFFGDTVVPPAKPPDVATETKKVLSDSDYENIKFDVIMRDDFDPQRILKWDDGFGTLPGSSLKFIINEFNIIEYVTDEDYQNIIEKRLQKAREKMKEDLQEEIRCQECGCFGLRSDFITTKYCSYDCQDSSMNRTKKKEEGAKRKKKKDAKVEQKQDKDSGNEDENSNDASQDKISYPWSCKKKAFSWAKYLDYMKAKPAPVKLFRDPFPYTKNGFRPGMRLEGVDPHHPSYFCVLSIAEVSGYRIRLHFDGYPDNYDFWCNADSMDIFPIGWCEKHGHTLQPPPGYTVENFNWVQYLKQTKSTSAPKHLFANRAGQAICPNGFRIGMKFEAVDRKNTSLICVATIRDMMDNRLLVHFDSWDDIYDYWADPTSPYIHPVGWCDQYGHNLTPPNDYPNPESFSWEVYLKETKSAAAPVRAFKQRPSCGFKRGMRLECVDKRVPHLIRVATVDDVKEHQIRIHFDGWPDRYSYWVDDDSSDIHPVGWCQKTGHTLQPPLTPDDVYDFLECPTVGCRGQGHIKGPKYSNHSTQKYCPYAEENIDVERVLPDRLLSPGRSPEAVVPVSREPKECKIKPRIGRPPKYLKQEIKTEPEEIPEKKPKRKYVKRKKLSSQPESEEQESEEQKAEKLIEQSKVLPAEKESWIKHSQFLKSYIDSGDDPWLWSCSDVIDFVSLIPGCDCCLNVIRQNGIDGEAFLMLTQKDILCFLDLKVGPAVKLYNSIVLLRDQFVE